MNISYVEQLRSNLRVFEMAAEELHQRIEKSPVVDRSALKSELATMQSHIEDLKRQLAGGEGPSGE